MRIVTILWILFCSSTALEAQIDFRRGDVDGDGRVHPVLDAEAWIVHEDQGFTTLPCLDAGDLNDDGALTFLEHQLYFGHYTQSLVTIGAPGVFTCGPDPTADALSCSSYDCAAVPPLLPIDPGVVFTLTGGTANVNETVEVQLWIDTSVLPFLHGWSFGLCHDPNSVELIYASYGPDIPAIPPQAPRFRWIRTEDAGWMSHVFGHRSDLVELLPPGTYHAYTAHYLVIAEGTSTIDFCATIADGVNLSDSPIVAVAHLGDPVEPVTMSTQVTGVLLPTTNDTCATATPIGEGTVAVSLLGAETDGPDLTASSCLFDQVHRDVWYSYTAGCTGDLTLSTAGSGLDTRIVVYSPASCGFLTDSVEVCNDDDPALASGESRVTIPVSEGEVLAIQVGTASDSTTGNLAWLHVDCSGTSLGEFEFDTKVLGTAVQGDDFFGASLAVDGEVAVVGAPGGNGVATSTGTAYVFRRIAGQWQEEQTLFASDGTFAAEFGRSVAIDGDRIVVGAQGVNRAYEFTFDGSSWNETEVIPSPGPTVQFAWALALDGDRLAIGAPGGGFTQGLVHTYLDGGDWILEATLSPSGNAGQFGSALALTADRLVVGAPDPNTEGEATIYDWVGGAWIETAVLTATDSAINDKFGASVAMEGELLAVGASFANTGCGGGSFCFSGSTYAFEMVSGVWTEVQQLTRTGPEQYFGHAVAIDNSRLIVTAPGAGAVNRGEVDVFVRRGAEWTFDHTFVAPDAADDDYFGSRLATSDGFAVVLSVGDDDIAPDAGSVYIMQCPCGTGPTLIRGDVNNDTGVDLADAIALLLALFDSTAPAPTCEEAADANDDLLIDISDAIYLLGYLFIMGPPPSAPFPDCAPDPDLFGLDCMASGCP